MGISDKTQKSEQKGSTTATYGNIPVVDTPDIIAARADKPQIDPSIGYRLGEKERQLQDSFASPTGGYVTGQIRDAILRSGQRNLAQQAGEQAREGQFDVNRLNQSKNLALAGLTRGQIAQTGTTSTGSGKVTQADSPFATGAAVAGQLAPLSL